jgi:hypothetical protein
MRSTTTKNKFQELGSRMSDLDSDLEGQTLVRRQRAMQQETMYSDLVTLQKMMRQLDERLHGVEDHSSRLERGAATEKDLREVLEKTTMKLVDDRYKMAAARIEQEKFERESDSDILKKRIHQLEENFGHLMNTVEEERKVLLSTCLPQLLVSLTCLNPQLLRSVERHVAKLQDRINALQQQVENEAAKRLEEGSNSMKTLNASLISLQSLVNSEAHVRDREIDKLKNLCNREFEDIRRGMGGERKDGDLRMSKLMQPLADEVKNLANELANERNDREAGDLTVVQKLGEQLAELKRTIDNEMRSREEDNNLKLKAVDDRFWKVNYQLDKEREGREKGDKGLLDALEEERRSREEAEEALATLLDQTIFRVKAGMELPGNQHMHRGKTPVN